MSMHADEESDEGVVPMKRSNNEGISSAETVEGRTSPKGNGGRTAAARTLRRDTASNGLIAVRRAARQSKSVRFTALLHHITIGLLKQSYLSLERDSAPGIDGVTWQTYGESLEEKLKELHDKVHRGGYRARPARRTYIPKADGSKRPLSILCLARPPDGYTFVLGGWATHVLNSPLFKLQYDVQKDFEPVSPISNEPLLIVARKTLQANDLKEFIAWLKANPDKAMQGASGAGGVSTVSGLLFQKETGTRFRFVPYRGGLSPAMLDLSAGQIDFTRTIGANICNSNSPSRIKASSRCRGPRP
jgi:hypothetical protein